MNLPRHSRTHHQRRSDGANRPRDRDGGSADLIERAVLHSVSTIEQPAQGERRRRAVVALWAGIVGTILVLWLATPLRDWIDVARIVALLRRFGDSPVAPLVMMAGYLVGGLILFPVTVLIAVTVIAFGPALGPVYALAGCMLSATMLFEIGHMLPATALQGRWGKRLHRLRVRLGRFGIASMAIARIVPAGPFSVLCFVAGLARVRRRAYLLGTALGMLPGIAINALFIDRILAAIRHPSATTVVVAAAAVAFGVTVLLLLRRRFARSRIKGRNLQ
jgi:phospholipase D1/2